MSTNTAPDVLVDLTPLDTSSRFSGTGRYVAELARALMALTPGERAGLDVRGLTSLDGDVGSLAWTGSEALAYRDDEEAWWLVARRTRLVATLRRLDPRLFHATYHMGTPRGAGAPRVVTCLDIIRILLHRDYMPGRWAYRRLMVAVEAARFHGARRVIAISQHTADDLVRHLRVPASRIDVVPLAVDPGRFHPPVGGEIEAWAKARAARGLGERPYMLNVGAADPRKNVDTMIAAFAKANLEGVDLVFAGRLKPAHQATVDRALAEAGSPRNVRRLGFVPDAELPALLAGALALPFTSSYEGFGFTPLEAMACGCPVIATGATSIGEVCGDATLLAASRDVDAWADAMTRIARERTLAAELRRAGITQAAKFTWKKTALGTIASYGSALR